MRSGSGQLREQAVEFGREVTIPANLEVVREPQTIWENVGNRQVVRKVVILMVLAAIWEGCARRLNNPLLVPTFSEVIKAFTENMASGELLSKSWYSMRVLLTGYGLGIVLAAILTILAISTRIGNDFLETLTSMLNPLPAIALLPLALIWFGLGNGSLVFVLIHSVLWPVALNCHSGFMAVSPTVRMVGHNTGLRGIR